MDLPATRKEAREVGGNLYFTGEPCPRGHTAPRALSGNCIVCRTETNRRKTEQAKERRAKGEKFYFTGKPCKRGHIAKRYVIGDTCVECHPVTVERRRRKREAEAGGKKTYNTGEPCPNGHIADRYVCSGICVECTDISSKKYYSENREKCLEDRRRYLKGNRKASLARTRKYQAKRLERTPPWADLDAIQRFYEACPKGMNVDHVVPLQGELVSGLHVLANLQYLTESENKSKNNSFEPLFISAANCNE